MTSAMTMLLMLCTGSLLAPQLASAAGGVHEQRALQEGALDCSARCLDINPAEPCFEDASCAGGGIGCNAAGLDQACRFCSFGSYEPCPDDSSSTDPPTSNTPVPDTPLPTSSPSTTGGLDSCSVRCLEINASETCFLDSSCLDCTSDPSSCNGCNAAGLGQTCRFCSFGPYDPCPDDSSSGDTPTPSTPVPNTPTTPPSPAAPALDTYPQWREEVGYWLGEYTLSGADGAPFESPNFNYPYDSYKGFITGSIAGLAYRQRNVFLYPPQTEEVCAQDSSVTGEGTCGENGNSRIFSADQSASDEDRDGSLSGALFGGAITTKTTLVGDDNALLYQVYAGEDLIQSQLTTLTTEEEGAQPRRTRTAQSFTAGVPTSASFYRERRVSETEFYEELRQTLLDYNILTSDACTTDGFGGGPTGYSGGFEDCQTHLEESFSL